MSRKLVAAVATLGAAALAIAPAHAGARKTVSVTNNAFSPTTVKIHKGDTVAWKWTQGGVPHNVTPSGGGKGSRTTSAKGYTYTKAFAKAGTFTYLCTIHPSQMRITVKVS